MENKTKPSGNNVWRGALAILLTSTLAFTTRAERINQEGRILGPAPVVTTSTLFNTPAADAIVSAMQVMPRDSAWNEDISQRPLLSNSSAMILQITNDLGASRRTLRPFYEMNYVLVPDNQSRIMIPFFNYPDESDLDGGTFPKGNYPIPPNLPIETWPKDTGDLTLQQWQQDVNNTGGDRHAIIVAPGIGSIWETWLTKLTQSGWQASNGAKFDLNSNTLRPAGWTSGDAAGLPMFPALVRYDECQRGMVEHAVRLVVAKTRREYIYPARHYASSIPATSVNYPAMGQRLRLKVDFVIPQNWTIEERAVLLALKKYGAIVADNGNFFSISVCPDDRFAANAFDHLSTITIDNFDVIATTGPNEGPRSPGAPSVDAGPDQFIEPPMNAMLNGVVNVPLGNAAIQWRLYSGPAAVAFANPNQASTTVSFTQAGAYTLLLSANDGVHTVAYDALVVHVTGHATMGNISTRVDVRSGQSVSIGGFIIAGPVAKNVIVRAMGPSLADVGVQGSLADPTLELRDSSGNLLQANDNWKDTQEQAIRDTTLAPSNDLESAIVASLAPGAYTAIVSGKNNTIGIGLVEVYDLQRAPASKLANISTRGSVGTGENVMIGGLILLGPDPARILFRAIGPSLVEAGIQSALADPQLDLFDAQGTRIATNNNWKDSQQAAIQGTGAAPTDDLESAILADLNPGSYTAIVSGVNGGTGTALIEAYYLQ
jgi:K319-like protein